jgi:hypothetical protein
MKNLPQILLGALLLGILSCSPRMLTKDYNEEKIQNLYSLSIGDAAKPQAWEVVKTLTPASIANPALVKKNIDGEDYLLVSTWTNDTIYYKNDTATGRYNTGEYPIWVTLAPELQNRCQRPNFGRREGLDLRIKQLLGLPPDSPKRFFVEFWVHPNDLFRPCPDPEINDLSCGLSFPEAVTQEHQQWVNELRLASYFNPSWNKNYPWTALGYTYDWNKRNKTNIGLSEYVIKSDRNIIVHAVTTTAEYCQAP